MAHQENRWLTHQIPRNVRNRDAFFRRNGAAPIPNGAVSFSDQRAYVLRWLPDGAGSEVTTLDIADQSGRLQRGATLRVDGGFVGPSQIDEHNGALRMLAHNQGDWVLQTFRVSSTQDITPLASLQLVIPGPFVRKLYFDGDRGYVVNSKAEQPVFTLDLSDPAAPRQVGELTVPGWVYQLKPRGDRLLALSIEPDNLEGTLQLSNFDVSDVSQPSPRGLVTFGEAWGLPGPQDRTHKLLNLIESDGLIVVPYGAYGADPNCGVHANSVQLVDWSRDALTKRGTAGTTGEAREALVLQNRLVIVTDDRVETFGILDRDRPGAIDKVKLARRVYRVAQVGGQVVRLGANEWTGKTELDVVPTSAAASPDSLGELAIQSQSEPACDWGPGVGQVFSYGDLAYVTYIEYDSASATYFSAVAVVQTSDPSAPKLLGNHRLEATDVVYGFSQVFDAGQRVAHLGTTLAFVQRDHISLVELSDPAAPKSTRVDLPNALWASSLMTVGNSFYVSHFEPLDDDRSRGRFYADRIELSAAGAPQVSKVNVPGSLLGVDVSGKVITLSYSRHTERVEDGQDECKSRHGNAAWYRTDEGRDDPYEAYNGPGDCTWYTHSVQLLDVKAEQASVDASHALADGQRPVRVAMGDGVFFAEIGGFQVLSGFSMGRLDIAKVAIPLSAKSTGDYTSQLVAVGKRAVFVRVDHSNQYPGIPQRVGVLDASTPAAPVLSQIDTLSGRAEDLVVTPGNIHVAVGDDGVETFPLQ